MEVTEPAMEPAALAEVVAVPTRVVTAALRLYQITRRRTALERRGFVRGVEAGFSSGSFGGNGIDDALEQVTGSSGCEDQLGIGRVVFQFGTKTGNMNIHHAGIHVSFWGVPPDLLQNLTTAEGGRLLAQYINNIL